MGGRWSGLGCAALAMVWMACGGTEPEAPVPDPLTRNGCGPQTCEQQGLECGLAIDGCGGVLRCGTCPEGEQCGGGGAPNVCGPASCLPTTCAPQGKNCGTISNGCGGTLDCGACFSGETCGGGGMPNVCGGASCLPATCAELGKECGLVPDGCGGVVECGTCPSGKTSSLANTVVGQRGGREGPLRSRRPSARRR